MTRAMASGLPTEFGTVNEIVARMDPSRFMSYFRIT